MDYESFKEKFVEDLKDRLDDQGAGVSLMKLMLFYKNAQNGKKLK